MLRELQLTLDLEGMLTINIQDGMIFPYQISSQFVFSIAYRSFIIVLQYSATG